MAILKLVVRHRRGGWGVGIVGVGERLDVEDSVLGQRFFMGYQGCVSTKWASSARRVWRPDSTNQQ